MQVLMRRNKVLVNYDPQGRCYDGCYFDARWEWGPWEDLHYLKDDEDPDEVMKFLESLNEIAVSARGESARSEYRVIERNERMPE